MKTVIGVATFKGREKALQMMLDSVAHQVDEVVLYDNEINLNLTDNGKFYGLTMQKEPCYYFTCDDDLLYPPNYIESMVESINRLGTIVTHHGRILVGHGLSYYRGHKAFKCLDNCNYETIIDVCGTGVTGFRTDYFNPIGIHNSKDKKMSDLIFSLEAKKEGKDINVLKHKQGWIKQLPIDHSLSIAGLESRNEERQIEIANLIYKMK